MVIDKEHNQLWVSQGSRTHLQRIDLASGRITAVDLGEPQSDLALWPDSSLLAVTLPASRSIAVLDEPAGTPRRIDNMPRYLPPDAASDEADVFMGDIPHRLFAAGAQVEHPELTVRCTSSDDSRTDTFSRYIIAASLRGSMRFLVPASGGSSLTLADSKACVSPSVDSDSDLGQWFLPCEGRPRPHSCIPGSGIAVYPGYTAASTWEVRWQGDLTAQQGAEGDGVIDESGRLDLSASSFQPGEVDIRTRDEDESGDILIILQAPLASPSSCREIYGDEDQLSKRSFQITSRSGDIIELDEPLDQNCFPAIGEDVSFAIRARDSFVVYRSYEIDEEIRLEYQGRVSPGERFSSGSSNDPSSFLSFTIDPTVCGGSCANDEGVVFDVEAPFAPVIAGGNNAGTVGRLPSRLAFIPVERGAQMPLAVLYSASNLLFLQLSLDSSSIFDADMIHNYD
jgi:hypothetical protein